MAHKRFVQNYDYPENIIGNINIFMRKKTFVIVRFIYIRTYLTYFFSS